MKQKQPHTYDAQLAKQCKLIGFATRLSHTRSQCVCNSGVADVVRIHSSIYDSYMLIYQLIVAHTHTHTEMYR